MEIQTTNDNGQVVTINEEIVTNELIEMCKAKSEFFWNKMVDAESVSAHGMARMNKYYSDWYREKAASLTKLLFNQIKRNYTPFKIEELKNHVSEIFNVGENDYLKLEKMHKNAHSMADIYSEKAIMSIMYATKELNNDLDRFMEKLNTGDATVISISEQKIHDYYEDCGKYESEELGKTII